MLMEKGNRTMSKLDGLDYYASLGDYQPAVDAALADLQSQNVMKRIWAHDYTVWKPEPTEISNRLGWLHSPENMVEHLPAINEFVDAVRADGYTHALLLGMGSSLAPEVFRRTFGVKEGYLDLAVLDSTDPDAVLAYANQLDMSRTLFLVSTKSGGTVETLSFFKFFYNRVLDAVGEEEAGQHFIAITDPGSGLVDTANTYKFRKIFLNDPDIGGRYSALSHFGIVPAALIGVDTAKVLERARTMAVNGERSNSTVDGDNVGAWLGSIIGEMATIGRDKVTLVTSPPFAAFGSWVEQLVAESTGKEGTGILPVVDEPLGVPAVYGNDRLFVYLRLEGDETYDEAMHVLMQAEQPVVYLHLRDLYDLGGEFFLWEIAIALAGRRIGINPFDQPGVEAAKSLAREMVAAYQKDGRLPDLVPTMQANGITVYADDSAESLTEALNTFLALGRPGDYIALQAYVQPAEQTTTALQHLRILLRDTLALATTSGYGPRFLHSTGQLHKGDAGNGLFIQFTGDPAQDAPIPDRAGTSASSITFGILIKAQSLGDRQALLNARPPRRVIRFHLGKDVVGGLERLKDLVL